MAGERVADWYKGRSVLITGGTGYLGKALVEKVLRSCPQVSTVYVLCRPRHGRTAITRLADLILAPAIFDRLKKESPHLINKLVAVSGDLEDAQVISSDKDRERILSEVSVVFHLGASTRTDATLAPAVNTNVKGTLHLVQLCKHFKQLKMLVHVSTAFCHPEQDVLEEKIYPPPRDPYEVMNLVASVDNSTLQAMTPGILGIYPNTYVFTKRLSESIVNEYSSEIPAIIVRPSTVTPAVYEPVPGWVDSLNGPVGLLVAAAKGVTRSILCSPDNSADIIPVDLAINSMLSIASSHCRNVKADKGSSVGCYNVTSSDSFPITWKQFYSIGSKQFSRYPVEAGLWAPGAVVRSSPFFHALTVLFLQTLPAYFLDFLLLLLHKKTFLVRMQNRISANSDHLRYISTRSWKITTDKGVQRQVAQNHPEDSKIFFIDNFDKDVEQYMLKVALGARQFCLREPLSSLNKAKIQQWALYLLSWLIKALIGYFIYWHISAGLELMNPSLKLPLLGYDSFDYLLQRALA